MKNISFINKTCSPCLLSRWKDSISHKRSPRFSPSYEHGKNVLFLNWRNNLEQEVKLNFWDVDKRLTLLMLILFWQQLNVYMECGSALFLFIQKRVSHAAVQMRHKAASRFNQLSSLSKHRLTGVLIYFMVFSSLEYITLLWVQKLYQKEKIQKFKLNIVIKL